MNFPRIIASLILCAPIALSAQPFAPASKVNPFIGTGGHGHTYPGATAPFGMVQLSPDTRLTGWDGCSGYHYSDSAIYGFSHTHLSGTGVADYCDILLMPTIGEPVTTSKEYVSPFRKETEKAEPGYYTVFLDKPKVKVELTASARVGFHRYTFPKSKEANILLDLEHRDEVLDAWIEVVNDYEVHGFRRSKSWAKNQLLYFVIRFSKPIDGAFTAAAEGEEITLVPLPLAPKTLARDQKSRVVGKKLKSNFRFRTKAGEQILVKVGISAVSIDGALANLNSEIPGWDFDGVRKQTFDSWNQELSKIEVSGGTAEQETIFYSALYHCMSVPNLFMDADGQYLGTDQKPHTAEGFTPYTIFSLWDTYRAYHPLMTIIDTHRTTDYINTFLSHYKNGGLLPVWELAGNETFCMIGYHSVPVIVDAYMKGIRGFDANLALEAMRHSATRNQFGLDVYRSHGCIPGDLESEGVSKTLEYSYDDWCIAQLAKDLGKGDVYNEFIQRAQYYRNMFDGETGFMRPRINGGFKKPFDPTEVDFNFTEGNSWQYSFYVPQDITGLAKLHGGMSQLASKLDLLFTTNQNLSGREQVDITGLVGQYAHGNEPSHHMAYLYNYVGQPWKTQQRVRQLMDEMYSAKPDGLIGNEDCGQMSAWLVMSAMGFYPVCPGSNQYAVGTPWFTKTTVHLENGKSFTISAPQVDGKNFYVQSATLNGKSYGKSFLNHADIMAGGELSFVLSNEPNQQWGVGEGNEPATSIEEKSRTTIPTITATSRTFTDTLKVTLQAPEKDAKVIYTLDGSDPRINGMQNYQPINLTGTYTIKAIAVAPGKDTSFTVEGTFYRVATDKKITIASKVNSQYTAGGPEGLIDGIRGAENFRLGGWQGYQDQDFEAVVDLGKEKPIKLLSAGFLQDAGSWIMMPTVVEFYTSNDDITYYLTAKVANTVADTVMTSTIQDLSASVNTTARYVKVVARNYGALPKWHLGAGFPAFIFVDEIEVE
jgi:predicted alpha-1,2-mannosidase